MHIQDAILNLAHLGGTKTKAPDRGGSSDFYDKLQSAIRSQGPQDSRPIAGDEYVDTPNHEGLASRSEGAAYDRMEDERLAARRDTDRDTGAYDREGAFSGNFAERYIITAAETASLLGDGALSEEAPLPMDDMSSLFAAFSDASLFDAPLEGEGLEEAGEAALLEEAVLESGEVRDKLSGEEKPKRSRDTDFDVVALQNADEAARNALLAATEQRAPLDFAPGFDPGAELSVTELSGTEPGGKKIAGLEHTNLRVVDARRKDGGVKEAIVDVAVPLNGGGQGDTLANSPRTVIGSGTFDKLLAAELQKNAGDLVKAGTILLQDNNVGTIRLLLHPDTLGNVKIDLKLADGRLSGSIACASEEAYRALKETIPSLKEAFSQGGFETGAFDLTWGQNSGDPRQGNQFADRQPSSRDYAAASGEYEMHIADGRDVSEFDDGRAVNLVA